MIVLHMRLRLHLMLVPRLRLPLARKIVLHTMMEPLRRRRMPLQTGVKLLLDARCKEVLVEDHAGMPLVGVSLGGWGVGSGTPCVLHNASCYGLEVVSWVAVVPTYGALYPVSAGGVGETDEARIMPDRRVGVFSYGVAVVNVNLADNAMPGKGSFSQ